MRPEQWDITQWPSLEQIQASAQAKGPVGWEQMAPFMDAVNPMAKLGGLLGTIKNPVFDALQSGFGQHPVQARANLVNALSSQGLSNDAALKYANDMQKMLGDYEMAISEIAGMPAKNRPKAFLSHAKSSESEAEAALYRRLAKDQSLVEKAYDMMLEEEDITSLLEQALIEELTKAAK
jgi:hypothetical protein